MHTATRTIKDSLSGAETVWLIFKISITAFKWSSLDLHPAGGSVEGGGQSRVALLVYARQGETHDHDGKFSGVVGAVVLLSVIPVSIANL